MDTTISPWLIYFVMQADSMNGILLVCLICSLVGSFIGCLGYAMNRDLAQIWGDQNTDHDKRKFAEYTAWADQFKKIMKFSVIALVVSGPLVGLMPSTKTLVTVFAVPTLIQVASDVELDETAKKSIAAVNKLLDAYIEDAPKPQ